MATAKQELDVVNCLSFNQTGTSFVCGTNVGFSFYNTYPLKEFASRKIEGGVIIAERLFTTNIFAFVGSGTNQKYPSNKVVIWDDLRRCEIGELIFRSIVKGVRLKNDRIVIILDQKIAIYNFSDLKLIDQIETRENHHGLCAFCPGKLSTVAAFPSMEEGNVRVEMMDSKQNSIVLAHENDLAHVTLNNEGTLLATASIVGTLIRVFETVSGKKLYEFRRGLDKTKITYMCFEDKSKFLAVTSNKGTIHLFSLTMKQNDDEKEKVKNTKSLFKIAKNYLPKYFSSEWSYKQIKIPNMVSDKTIITFGEKENTLIAVNSARAHYYITFDGDDDAKYSQRNF